MPSHGGATRPCAPEKYWGKQPFWGVDFEYDPQWVLDEEQKEIQKKLIELCRTTLRPNAIISDETYEYPRKNMEALASIGLLGLMVPKALGGLGQSHTCWVMVVETIARYGCPSTGLVYVMHSGAVACAMFRYHDNPRIQELMRRLDKDKLIGTLSYSDPATGGHFWYALSSKCEQLPDGCFKLLKYASWTTSAGFADWYIVETVSPNFKGDYSNMSIFLAFKDEVRANTSEWKAMGAHGNQSGPMITEGVFTPDRLVGPIGDGQISNDEIEDPFFMVGTSACWTGIAMGCIDVAKKHVTQKRHADVGMRVCDYPTIQDYFGESIAKTNASRMALFGLAQAMDKDTNNCDWNLHKDLKFCPRWGKLHWCWQVKFTSAYNVAQVGDCMLHACGGTGYKSDLGLERLIRDGKAGWVMGPSCEVTRQFIGQTTLLGMDCIDYWAQTPNTRVVHTELKKMTTEDKRKLAARLLGEVQLEEKDDDGTVNAYQDTHFDNPFNTAAPTPLKPTAANPAGLTQDKFTPLKLAERIEVNEDEARFKFALPNSKAHLGCMPGQYVQIQVVDQKGKAHQRFMSPMNKPEELGLLELGIKFESHGVMSAALRNLKQGESIEVCGPMGGYEYAPNTLDHLTLICSGSGATPAIQIIRCVVDNKDDKTKISMLYHAKTEEELLCKEELDGYATRDPRIQAAYTLDEVDEVRWTGKEGNFDLKMLEENMPKPNGLRHKVVICGGPHTAITALQLLYEMGFKSSDIFVYGQFGAELVRSVYGRKTPLTDHKSTLA